MLSRHSESRFLHHPSHLILESNISLADFDSFLFTPGIEQTLQPTGQSWTPYGVATGQTDLTTALQGASLSDLSAAFPRTADGDRGSQLSGAAPGPPLDERKETAADRPPRCACAATPTPLPEFWRKWRRVTSGLPLAAILRPRVCAPSLSWSARDPLSVNLSSPRGAISTPTR